MVVGLAKVNLPLYMYTGSRVTSAVQWGDGKYFILNYNPAGLNTGCENHKKIRRFGLIQFKLFFGPPSQGFCGQRHLCVVLTSTG